MKKMIRDHINSMKDELISISDYIYAHPELGNEEFLAVEKLTEFLKKNGFEIEMGIAGKATAFHAVYDSGLSGAHVAFLCEYDALPGIGHGCGHNMIGTMGAGAGVALSKVLSETGGKISVFGTPAEETDGAKVEIAKQGLLDSVDAAMILHPGQHSVKSGKSLAMDALQFSYKGKASHAAAQPEKGINALDAVLLLFNGINALRQHVTSDVRLHGIITEGGLAANIVPEEATAQFYIRAATREVLDSVVEKVKNIAEGASLMTGAVLTISSYEISYDNMKTNETLSDAFSKNLLEAGETTILSPERGSGSIDMGNVSYKVPAIHPYLGFGAPNAISHSVDFANATITDAGHEALIRGINALSYTGFDLLTDDELLTSIKKEFLESKEV
ncbi:MAG TPA: M20 family metallopeptidase [Proteiniclasticum sp.]|nr:M20 family metallopeptidase [Proteiniclasticum sp.]